ncbi:hypothetical protein HY522_01695 [bacterium]|nr:hypothetical protein [bacterium]
MNPLILIFVLLLSVFFADPASALTERPLDDWYDPGLPVFVSDVVTDPGRGWAFVSDQITGRIFRVSLPEGAVTPFESPGFSPEREEILSLVSKQEDLDRLLEGEIKLDWEGSRLLAFDGRVAFGADRWLELTPSLDDTSAAGAWASVPHNLAPPPVTPRVRDQSLLAQAVADLAGRGRRVRPLRWSTRDDSFQLIDRHGRAYLFWVESGVFGQKRIKYAGEIPSLISRLMDLSEATLESETAGVARIEIGRDRWRARLSDDPYTGERLIQLNADTTPAAPIRAWAQSKTGETRLPANWLSFFRNPRVLAEGPAGQLVLASLRLTEIGPSSVLALVREDQIRMFPALEPAVGPEDVVALPEGFLVKSPPHWRLIGPSPEFSGYVSFGNSRFEKIAPILHYPESESETMAVTFGVFVLDAERAVLTAWPAGEWTRYASVTELRITADPVDLTVGPAGMVYVMAKDAERGLRIFRLTEAPEPILDLPEDILPGFLPGSSPTLISKTETRQTLWSLSGQPPSLIRKDRLGIVWSVGDGIAWKPEPDGVLLFSTDPAGHSDTAVTVVIEGIDHVRRAVKIGNLVWMIETESGILQLDARDLTAPEIIEVSPAGSDLRAAPSGALYTVHRAGSSEVRLAGFGVGEKSLGRFRESWRALGSDGKRIFFHDIATDKFYAVRTAGPADYDVLGHVTGRVEFNYDDPSDVFVCIVGENLYGSVVRPETPTFLLGPMPPGSYNLDVSAGLYDLVSPKVYTVTQSELAIPEVNLTKSLEFIFRRAAAFEESGNTELARFNYDLYLNLYPSGRMADQARSRLVAIEAGSERWDKMVELFKSAPPETNWSPEVLRLLIDHMPALSDRIDLARKILNVSAPDARSAPLLFFLYKYSLDPIYKTAAREPGIPPVYARFFESFDALRQ